jgi:DNA polymerase-4
MPDEPQVRKIIHVDMDCFYAAVEVLDNPAYRGKPLIVGGREKRGVVSAASYEARAYGVRSAMPVSTAMTLCKHAINVPGRMSRYKEISQQIHRIFRRYTDIIQPISLDEAFLDVTQNKKNIPYATIIAKEIKKSIQEEIGLIASAGVAPNRFLAKIASDQDKPDGLFVIRPHEIEAFMQELPIGRIWGVGKVMGKTLEDLGIHKAADVQKYPLSFLEKKFGKMGLHLFKLSQGIDPSPVKPYREAKSIGKERTFLEDIYNHEELKEPLRQLAEKVSERLAVKSKVVGGVTLKLKYANFQQITRSKLLNSPVSDVKTLLDNALEMLLEIDVSKKGVRLIGLSTYKLSEHPESSNVFDWMNDS